jgi:DNA-binding transcriptional MerR regulator
MKNTSGNCYSPHKFARRSGVTVRTLHYYDQMGLLKPSDHTGVGFRLYRDDDFVRLQQIVTLKFIGFSLKEIKHLLDRKGSGLSAALRAQRMALEQKRRHLDSAIQAIANAEGISASRSRPDWETFQRITEEIQRQTNPDGMKKYYSEQARKLLAQRQTLRLPELQKEVEEKWAVLLQDIEAATTSGMDPASPPAQALAERQAKLIECVTSMRRLANDLANFARIRRTRLIE